MRLKNDLEDLLLSKTKKCETLIQQTQDWMIGLTDREVYNSIFNVTEENNKFELYKFRDEKAGGVSYTKVRDEIEEDLDISDITAVDLQDDLTAPNIIDEYREQVTKRMKDGQYMNFLSIYTNSIFQDFKSFLRTQIDMLKMILNWL